MGSSRTVLTRLKTHFSSPTAVRQLRRRVNRVAQRVADLEAALVNALDVPDGEISPDTRARAIAVLGRSQVAKLVYGVGRDAFKAGDFNVARRRFAAAVELTPEHRWRRVWLARAENKLGLYGEALASARAAVALDAGFVAGWFEVVDACVASGDQRGSVAALRSLLECAQVNAAQLRKAARSARRVGDEQVVIAATRRLVEADPDDDDAVVALAVALSRAGDHDEAHDLLGVSSSPVGVRVAAQLELEADRPEAAWNALRDADVRDARLLTAVGHALRRGGFLDLAYAAFTKAAAVDPDDARIQWALGIATAEQAVMTGQWSSGQTASQATSRVAPQRGRILHVVGKSLPHEQDGYGVRTQSVAKAQRDAGLDPHVVSRLGFPWELGGTTAPMLEHVDGIPYHRLCPPAGLSSRLDHQMRENAEQLARLLRRVRPSVLHAASDFRNAMIADEVGRLHSLPVIYEVRGFWEETWLSSHGIEAIDRAAYRWRKEREQACAVRADRVVTLSQGMRSELIDRGVDGDKIVIVPNAVDVHLLSPEREGDGEAVRRALGIADVDVVLGYVSSFVAYEGIKYLIQAARLLLDGGHRVKVLLVGDGDERQALECTAAEEGIADHVLFTGRVPHSSIIEYYRAIDVFVVPRTNDRVCHLVTPLKPYEAMALARPVVVAGVTALQEMVVAEKTGLVFEPENAKDLARVLEPLVTNADERERIALAGMQWVRKNRTWRSNGEIYRQMYESLGVL